MVNKLSDLKAAEYNPRSIQDSALQGLKFSLEEFGDISGIVFNERTGNLVAGHQRVMALKEICGDAEIKDGLIVTDLGTWKVRIVDWDIEKEKAANIAANAESIQGEWTPGASLVIEEIALSTPELFNGLNLTGLTIPELFIGNETLEVEKQESDISQEQRSSLKFGDVTIYLSGSELEEMMRTYKNYVSQNRNSYGFVTYLLEGK